MATKSSDNARDKKLLPISKAAGAAGVSRQTLQYYIMVGLIEPAQRSSGGRGLFDQACIERIKMIRKLNQSGYPLREIREIFLRGQR
jgi:DNA-binding transcriptional MerR regulator